MVEVEGGMKEGEIADVECSSGDTNAVVLIEEGDVVGVREGGG